ncbi:MAG TPA: FecR family protein [Candidatus Limnocylindria bacterium]|nr:FecR family protein [Candidatus Limnocylindria bacterium]
MKLSKRLVALVVILAVFVGGGVYLFLPRGENLSASVAATLAILNTDITAQKAGGGDFEPALDGQLFATGDVVKSSAQGRAVLTFFDGSTLTVETGSQVKVTTLNRLAGGGIQLTIEQTLGRTWASVAKLKTPDSKFEIKTPTSVASVRGTAFETVVVANPDGSTSVTYKADEGLVLVSANAGGSTNVPANTQVTVSSNQQAPAQATAIAPTASLRLTSTGPIGYAVIAPTGATCGSEGNRAEIPGCVVNGNAVTIREPVPGRYVLWMTASAAAPNATVKVDSLRGVDVQSTQTFTRTFALGDLIRTAFNYATATPIGSFEPAEQISSVCGAQATGRVFSGGTIDERYDLLRGFAASNRNAPASLVVTSAELNAAGNRWVSSDPGSQVQVKDLKITVDPAGMHLTANIVTPLGTFAATGDVIGGPVNGRLVMKVRNFAAGPVPPAILEQIQVQVERGLNEFAAQFPISVRQVALRTNCLGIMGTTPQ